MLKKEWYMCGPMDGCFDFHKKTGENVDQVEKKILVLQRVTNGHNLVINILIHLW